MHVSSCTLLMFWVHGRFLIFEALSINSVNNKFDALVSGILGNIDKLMVLEIKLDYSFPTRQFLNKVP